MLRFLPVKQDSVNLDVLRSMAILLVVAAHLLVAAGQDARFLGPLGVQLFFIHTCAVLMFSLERRPGTPAFFLRRFFRIYPLSIFCVLAAVLFHIPSGSGGHFIYTPASAGAVASNLLLIQNLTHSYVVIAVLWSLPLEIQMYTVLPMLYRMNKIRIELLWMLAVAVASLHLTMIHGLSRLTILDYVPDFLAGVVAYRVSKTAAKIIPAWLWLPFLMALAGVYYFAPPSQLSGWCVSFAVGWLIPRFMEIKTGSIFHSVAHSIARYSYGIYLAHLFCIWVAFVRFSSLPVAGRIVLFAILLGGIPFALYHAIERPCMWMGARAARGFAAGDPIAARVESTPLI